MEHRSGVHFEQINSKEVILLSTLLKTGAKMCLHKDDSISTLIFEVVRFGTSIAQFVGIVEENSSF